MKMAACMVQKQTRANYSIAFTLSPIHPSPPLPLIWTNTTLWNKINSVSNAMVWYALHACLFACISSTFPQIMRYRHTHTQEKTRNDSGEVKD